MTYVGDFFLVFFSLVLVFWSLFGGFSRPQRVNYSEKLEPVLVFANPLGEF